MHWKDDQTISIYDLFKDEQQKFSLESQKDFNNDRINNQKLIELRTKPSKSLVFSSSLNSMNLKLFNDNSFPIIFKLKTTQPDILASQPARGFIPRNSFLECHLTPIENKHRIFLVIQYAQIVNEYDDYLTQWKNLRSENIFIKKYQCLFTLKTEQCQRTTFVKPILFTFATMTLLTTLIYWRNK